MIKIMQKKYIGVWLLVTLITILVVSGSLGMLWMRQEVASSAYKRIELEKSLSALERQSSQLESQLSRLQSPEYFYQRLGIERGGHPLNQRVVWVSREGVDMTRS